MEPGMTGQPRHELLADDAGGAENSHFDLFHGAPHPVNPVNLWMTHPVNPNQNPSNQKQKPAARSSRAGG
jgi:hypothetical protein